MVVGQIAQQIAFTREDETCRLDLLNDRRWVDAVQLRSHVGAAARRCRVIDDQIGASSLQEVEDVAIESRDVDLAVLGNVQIVVVERGPENIDLLGEMEISEQREIQVDVLSPLLVKNLARGVDVLLAPPCRLERIDSAMPAHDIAQQARVITSAWKELADRLPRLYACEGEQLSGLAHRIELMIGLGTAGVCHRLRDIGWQRLARCSDGDRSRWNKQSGHRYQVHTQTHT